MTEDETRPTVQLRHELPDGSSHVDWMLARDPLGRAPLVTFRLPGRVDELAPGTDGGTMRAERIADHRPSYLTHEGPVSRGRGVVRRLRSGRILEWTGDEAGWRLTLLWASQGDGGSDDAGPAAGRATRQTLFLEPRAGGRWDVSAVSVV